MRAEGKKLKIKHRFWQKEALLGSAICKILGATSRWRRPLVETETEEEKMSPRPEVKVGGLR